MTRYFDWNLNDMKLLIEENIKNKRLRNCFIGRVNKKIVQYDPKSTNNLLDFDLFKENPSKRIVL